MAETKLSKKVAATKNDVADKETVLKPKKGFKKDGTPRKKPVLSKNAKERNAVFKTVLKIEIGKLKKVKKCTEIYDRKELQDAFKKAAKSTSQFFVNKGK